MQQNRLRSAVLMTGGFFLMLFLHYTPLDFGDTDTVDEKGKEAGITAIESQPWRIQNGQSQMTYKTSRLIKSLKAELLDNRFVK